MSNRFKRRGLMLVISSPSGAGKTSLSRRLIEDRPGLSLSISATTRPPRPGEVDGREYHFVTAARFQEMVDAGAFMEWAEVHEHRYGSPRDSVATALEEGNDILFDVDWQGSERITRQAPDDTVSIFILPPSLEALARRLHHRAQDSEVVIERRLARAREEIGHWQDYHYVIVNDDFDRALAEIEAIYLAERLKRARNGWLTGFVAGLAAPGPG